MKITQVELFTVPDGHSAMLLVVVHTDDGVHGIGEVGMRSRWRAVRGAVDDFAEELVGADPSRTEHLWQVLSRFGFFPTTGVLGAVLAAIDVALWDIRGKVLGVPLYQLLGGASRDHVECYVHVYGADQGTLVEEAQTFVAAGWRYLRISADSPEPGARYADRAAVRHAIATVQRLREALGEDVELLLDVHTRLDPAQAVTLCRELEPLRPFFVEDPLRSENLDSYRTLRQRTGVPIAAGEQLEVDVGELTGAGHATHLQEQRPWCWPAVGVDPLQAASGHQRDQLVLGRRLGPGGRHHGAVANHHDRRGQLGDLGEPVRHVDHQHPAVL